MWLILCVIHVMVSSLNCDGTDVECASYKAAHPEIFEPQTKCYTNVGCFFNGKAWSDGEKRPYSPVPEDVKVTYGLFTPKNPKKVYSMDMSTKSIKRSPFDPSLPTQIVIHGYKPDDASSKFIWDFKDAVLSVGKYNVLVPDFRDGMKMPYCQAVANIRVAAAKIAQLLTKIMKIKGAKAEDFHLSGCNLGGQTCGYVGKLIPNTGRITALSPTTAYFEGTAKFVHLTESDASFVDIIHTNDEGFHCTEPIGNQDFYVNSGSHQPGCPPSNTQPSQDVNYSAEFDATSCDHQRANALYLESVTGTNNCTFKAVECGSYQDFQDKKCSPENSREAIMGFYAKPIPGVEPKTKFYLKTRGEEPYCDNNIDAPKEDDGSIGECIMKSLLELIPGF